MSIFVLAFKAQPLGPGVKYVLTAAIIQSPGMLPNARFRDPALASRP